MKSWIKPQAVIQALSVFLFTAFYFIATQQGNLKTRDSLNYLAIAKNISTGNGFYDASGAPLTYWPPLYPLILSVGIHHPAIFIFLLHLLSMWGIIFLWLLIAQSILKSQTYGLLYGCYMSTSTPLLMIATFIWSETLFLLLFSTYLYFLWQFVNTGRIRWLLVAVIPGFLMLLQRHAGLFLFVGVMIGLSVTVLRKENWKYLLLHGGLVIAGSLCWNIYQFIIYQDLNTFQMLVPEVSPIRNAKLVLGELALNFLPLQLTGPSGSIMIILVLITFLWFWQKRYINHTFIALLFITLIAYLAAWIIIPASKDDISRFISLVLPLFYLLFISTVQAISHQLKDHHRNIVLVSLVCHLTYPLIRLIHNAMQWGGLLG